MILSILDERLPMELSDKIYHILHRSTMKDICIIINFKIVFVLVGKRMSFLICEHQNYFSVLDVF